MTEKNVVITIGLDRDGEIVEDLKDAYVIRETEYDEDDNLIRSTTYMKEGEAI